MLLPGFLSNELIHITFDNFDEKKQTVTGSQTTLHTTSTIFQVKSDNNNNTKYPEIGDILDEDEETDF